jgi:hypothetical protein
MFIHGMTLCSFTGKQIVGKQSLAAAATCIPQKEAIINAGGCLGSVLIHCI